MENSNNEDDEYTEFCENTITKFKNLLREVILFLKNNE